MRGCLRRIGCLVLLAGLAVALWYTRDHWLPWVRERIGSRVPRVSAAPAPAAPGPAWDLITPDDVARGKAAVLKLSQRSGPVFANLSAAEFTGYIVDELSRELPPSAMGTTTTVIGDELFVRTMVRPQDLGADEALGPLKGLLGEREPMEMGGTLDVVRPGLGSWTVRSMRVATISVPSIGISRVLAHMQTGARPPKLPPEALPLVMPVQVADLRVRNGRITLYKAGQ